LFQIDFCRQIQAQFVEQDLLVISSFRNAASSLLPFSIDHDCDKGGMSPVTVMTACGFVL